MPVAIEVSGLGKRYQLGERERYYALRDSIAGLREQIGRSLRSSQRGQQREEFWALADVSFELLEGEVLGVVGRNGAGKSTLLKILSRITQPTTGWAELHGRVGSLLEVGTGFHPELTGRENVYLNGALLGMKRAEITARFDDIVEFAGLARFLDTPVKRYSSGMYMRLAFSVAAHLEPDILIVDEVLAVGDLAFQERCLGKMRDIAGGGRTVLFVSHNMPAVKSLCSRAILLEEGRKVAEGSVDDVITRYVSSVRASSSGEVARNAHAIRDAPLWLERVSIESANATGGTYWRDPIRLSLEVAVEATLLSVGFAIGIVSAEGIGVLTLHQEDTGMAFETFDGGRYRCSVEIENHLRPGVYTVVVGVVDAISRVPIVYVPDALSFEVLDVALDGSDASRGTGVTNAYGRWGAFERIGAV